MRGRNYLIYQLFSVNSKQINTISFPYYRLSDTHITKSGLSLKSKDSAWQCVLKGDNNKKGSLPTSRNDGLDLLNELTKQKLSYFFFYGHNCQRSVSQLKYFLFKDNCRLRFLTMLFSFLSQEKMRSDGGDLPQMLFFLRSPPSHAIFRSLPVFGNSQSYDRLERKFASVIKILVSQ